MTRVASLYLPALAIERLRRLEPHAPPESRSLSNATIEDGSSAPRTSGWRPGARWARGSANGCDVASTPSQGGSAAAQQRIPLVLAEQIGNRQLITAVCSAGQSLGLTRGMTVAHARVLVPNLDVRPANPGADRELLERLALHSVRHWTPTTAVGDGDGLVLDLTGSTHLHGGEERFCRRVLGFCRRLGLTARIAVAGSIGAAHALARYGDRSIVRIDGGHEAEALSGLPLACLRLMPDVLGAAARFGLETVGDLLPMPRGPLARRLGLASVRRLDEALGRLAEPIMPLIPETIPIVTRRLFEPIVTAEAIERVIGDLLHDLANRLREQGTGARTLVLAIERVDGGGQAITIGTVGATRDSVHLARLFHLRIERIDPGCGIETMRLAAVRVEPLGARASTTSLCGDSGPADLATLIDQLAGRAGVTAVFTLGAVESDVPERATRRSDPLETPAGWPAWKRPVRLLQHPEPLSNVVALLPDHPPRRFAWRGSMHAVVAGDGPERIHGEWWRRDGEVWAVRDYFRVEDDTGKRFWLFRRGDGVDPATGDLSWYMHGLFG